MDEAGWYQRSHLFFVIVVAAAGLIYLFSHPHPQNHYDYTLRIAECLLNGQTGFMEPPPRWLNEFVPIDGAYFSVFPLGAAAGESLRLCSEQCHDAVFLVSWKFRRMAVWLKVRDGPIAVDIHSAFGN